MAPPQLQRISQNVYSLDLPTDSEMGLFSTASPVFSIQTESNQQYYQWMVDVEFSSPLLPVLSIMENLLDLSAFTGRRLSIAYAFATDEGISEYSQNEVVQVPGKLMEYFGQIAFLMVTCYVSRMSLLMIVWGIPHS